MNARTELIEITGDNHQVLGRPLDDVGYIALRTGSTVTTHPTMADALTAISDPLTGITPDIGECLPVGDGRRWMTVPDYDDDF